MTRLEKVRRIHIKEIEEKVDNGKNKECYKKKEYQDNVIFWEQQKKEYLEMNPIYVIMIAELEADTQTALAKEGIDGEI